MTDITVIKQRGDPPPNQARASETSLTSVRTAADSKRKGKETWEGGRRMVPCELLAEMSISKASAEHSVENPQKIKREAIIFLYNLSNQQVRV